VRRILLIDISDHVAGRIVEGVEERGCIVYRPQSLIEFTGMIGLTSCDGYRGWTPDAVPDIMVNFHSQSTPQIAETCEAAEMLGIRVMNTPHAVALVSDRRRLLHTLRKNRVNVPDFFWGHPSRIPEEFGPEVVLKDLHGHLVMRVRTSQIASRDELIYCERTVLNPLPGVIQTVYCICGYFFTVEKTDAFYAGKHRRRAIVRTVPSEIELMRKIRDITGLDFFNFDLIGDTVIDVNAFPNFFPYPDAVAALVDYVATIEI